MKAINLEKYKIDAMSTNITFAFLDNYLYFVNVDNTIFKYDIEKEKEIQVKKQEDEKLAVIKSDGKYLYTFDLDSKDLVIEKLDKDLNTITISNPIDITEYIVSDVFVFNEQVYIKLQKTKINMIIHLNKNLAVKEQVKFDEDTDLVPFGDTTYIIAYDSSGETRIFDMKKNLIKDLSGDLKYYSSSYDSDSIYISYISPSMHYLFETIKISSYDSNLNKKNEIYLHNKNMFLSTKMIKKGNSLYLLTKDKIGQKSLLILDQDLEIQHRIVFKKKILINDYYVDDKQRFYIFSLFSLDDIYIFDNIQDLRNFATTE